MPIYEYRCTSCGHELEVMQKVNDPAPASCPKCNTEQVLERLVSRTSFQLKGGGWYNDLYSSVKKDGGSSSPSSSTSSAPAPAPASSTSAPAAGSGGSTSGGSSSGGSSGGSSSGSGT